MLKTNSLHFVKQPTCKERREMFLIPSPDTQQDTDREGWRNISTSLQKSRSMLRKSFNTIKIESTFFINCIRSGLRSSHSTLTHSAHRLSALDQQSQVQFIDGSLFLIRLYYLGVSVGIFWPISLSLPISSDS
jgi:hypothetical protein